jgi:competence protein ComEC
MAVRKGLPLVFATAAALLALAHSGEIRTRAEAALGKGMAQREAALGRGFILGEDDEVDSGTKEDFRRSGLSHLLAVSGQNVALLGLLAMPFLAALGMSLRSRLLWVLGLIVVYVPLAGAGPSILRAGIMGGLSILATLAGRRTSRLYALVIAAGVLLAVEPGIAANIGWQLSFAAVLGILLLAASLRKAIGARFGYHGWRRPFVDGAAMTTAATLATAPLIAFHFEGISTTTLLANLLALPAVAPAMWLGMLVAAAGQVPGLPVELLNSVNALLLAYIAQIAEWCGRPSWAYLQVHLGIIGLFASYLGLAAASILAAHLGCVRKLKHAREHKPADGPKRGARLPFSAHRRGWVVGLVLGVCSLLALGFVAPGGGATSRPLPGLRVSVLDVGQGDAILLQLRGHPAVLVDGGPPGDGLAAKLRDAGVERLGAVLITHDQSDHAGGIRELFGAMPIGRVLYGVLRHSTFAAVLAARIPLRRVAGGAVVRSGPLRLSVLWPPAELLAAPHAGDDPNHLAVVLLARWRSFSMLLTADAEAEATPLEPGPIDVLKVAHHGSDDAGLGALLDRARPSLAVISVGAGNPFGHPTPATLATLGAHGVRTLRTDADGTLVLDVGHGSIRVRREG